MVIASKAEKAFRELLFKAFKNLGYVDGMALDEAEIREINDIIYWSQLLDNAEGVKKETYLVYTFQNPGSGVYADNDKKFQDIVLHIDLFSTLLEESKEMYKIRTKLEEELITQGFRVNFLYRSYDQRMKLFHYTYEVKLGYGEQKD